MSDYWQEQRYDAMFFAAYGRHPDEPPPRRPCAICGVEDDGIERGLYTAEQAASRNRWERANARRERRAAEIVGHEACRRCPDCGCSRSATAGDS